MAGGLTAYIGLTDRQWFDFLRSQHPWEEVNFWRPKEKRAFRVIETPEPEAVHDDDGHEWELRIKLRGQLTSVFYDFCPFDVVGWKGNLSVLKLNIRDIRPLMSDRIHLPPSAHTTFQALGIVIGSFLPRPLEGDPQAERVNGHHRDVDYDELYFVHAGGASLSGNPTTAMAAGLMGLEPQGLHHGPPKGEQEYARAHWRKNARLEFSVIIMDCAKPMELSPQAEEAERRGARL